MGPFVSLFGIKYILVVHDYISKWVEVVILLNNEIKSMITFLKRINFPDYVLQVCNNK